MKPTVALALVASLLALGLGLYATRTAHRAEQVGRKLVASEARVQTTEARVAALSSRVSALEKRSQMSSPASVASLPVAPAASPTSTMSANAEVVRPALPLLVSGSYVVEDNAVIYSPDARLRLNDSMEVSSPNGVMVSDLNQGTVVGDLTISGPDTVATGTNVRIDVKSRTIKANRLSVRAAPRTESAAVHP